MNLLTTCGQRVGLPKSPSVSYAFELTLFGPCKFVKIYLCLFLSTTTTTTIIARLPREGSTMLVRNTCSVSKFFRVKNLDL